MKHDIEIIIKGTGPACGKTVVARLIAGYLHSLGQKVSLSIDGSGRQEPTAFNPRHESCPLQGSLLMPKRISIQEDSNLTVKSKWTPYRTGKGDC